VVDDVLRAQQDHPRHGVAEPDHPSVVRAYDELIDLIQPILAGSIVQ